MNQFTNDNRTYKTGSFVMGRMNHKMVGKIAFAFGLLFAATQLKAAEEVYAPEVGEGRYRVCVLPVTNRHAGHR